ncbi:hypothetical protein [uncultured Lentibacter sp.]|jgi:outer membrane lipoprotein SlyB|uniref:hypothetical protein n=1 Tax=uncultured Lentibacter sp. TaxID=1659309 RepID=UPI00261AC9E5|nr:hypothetical protein [uncultured Lentibacter sp.]
MKPVQPALLALMACTALAGCATPPDTATRAQTAPLDTAFASTEYSALTEQARSLNRMADDLLRESTGRGAALGAAVGCGLGLVSKGNAQRCLAGAVTGGTVGAVMGQAHGQRKLAQRLEKVSRDDMAGALRAADTQLETLQNNLPALLQRQDAELKALQARHAAGTISQAEHDSRISQIRDSRAALAHALTNSAEKARAAADNLGRAAAKGQSGLIWHIGAAKQLEEQSLSTRSAITLL